MIIILSNENMSTGSYCLLDRQSWHRATREQYHEICEIRKNRQHYSLTADSSSTGRSEGSTKAGEMLIETDEMYSQPFFFWSFPSPKLQWKIMSGIGLVDSGCCFFSSSKSGCTYFHDEKENQHTWGKNWQETTILVDWLVNWNNQLTQEENQDSE